MPKDDKPMPPWAEFLQVALALIAMVVLATMVLSTTCLGPLSASEATVGAIETLQPAIEDERVQELANIIDTQAEEHGFDPKLIVAIIMRESSFSKRVESGAQKGQLNEIGLMQIHPQNGMAFDLRPTECSRDLEGAYCQIATGVRYLDWVRGHCPGTQWRYVAAYGMNRCPSESIARLDMSTKRARSLHLKLGGDGW